MFCCFIPFVTVADVKVTMNNGTVINGDLKELNPSSHITIVVDGIDVKIPMADVASIDKTEKSESTEIPSQNKSDDFYGRVIVTDNNDYPDFVDVVVGGQKCQKEQIT